jgi:hypothetical protein
MPVSWADVWRAVLDAREYILVGLAVAFVVVLALLVRVLMALRHLRHETRAGRHASRDIPTTGFPLTSFSRKGRAGDPLNVEMVGTANQIAAAFVSAGWYRADEIDFVTSVRISVDAVLGRKYSSAPVSNLFLYGRKEDLAFERPGRNVRERDHIRLWDTGRTATDRDRRQIWIGGATRDIKVVLAATNHLPTHQIAPDVDAERDLIVRELTETGWVIDSASRPGFGTPTRQINGTGDSYYTDGQVAVLVLADVPVGPGALAVRSPAGGLLGRAVGWIIRPLLPRRGRDPLKRR